MEEDKVEHRKFGKRHILAFWLFSGFVMLQVFRVSINVAIVSMVNDSMQSDDITYLNGTCPLPKSNENGSISKKGGEFFWDYETQGLILSSYYYGFASTQIISGFLVRKTGARLLMGVGVGVTSLLTLINPFAAQIGPELLIVVRLVEGLFQGVMHPSTYHILGFWAPKSERTIMVIFPISGQHVGSIISALLTGWLCDYGFAGGWPSSFYVYGGVGFLWCVGWFLCVHNSPAEHPSISEEERCFIEQQCPNAIRPSETSFWDVPWKSIFTSLPFWAAGITHFCLNWNYYTLLTEAATYLSDILHIGTFETGLVSSLPYVCFFVLMISVAILSDVIRAKGVRTVIVRKAAFCGGSVVSTAFLIAISYIGCDTATVIAILCLAVGFTGCTMAGWSANLTDLAPQYAGILIGITSTTATLPGIISPILTGVIINEESTIETWRTVFFISSAISIFGAVIFILFAQAEIQPWARSIPSTQKTEVPHSTVTFDADKETMKIRLNTNI